MFLCYHIAMKTCSKCGLEKPLENYYVDKTKADGKRPCCKGCDNERIVKTRKTIAYKVVFNPYQKEWQRRYRQTPKYKDWRKKALVKQSLRAKELKQQIVTHYGGQCACCGIKELCFLSIDHINNDGYKDRKEGKKYRPSGILLYKRIIKANYPDNLQIYCFNCNIAKQHNGGECPHKSIEIVRNHD